MGDYTPGPWRVNQQRGRGIGMGRVFVRAVPAKDYRAIAIVCQRVERTANADLISAAPELLEGLQHVQVCASCSEGSWGDCEGGRAALAAIAKATGQPLTVVHGTPDA